ncbi:prolipoprotein diacylglyceryl transferase [Candidatus Pelagibacter sp.]|nr:prolipoprotein diacylglyceryl transferase [Candidatus Pelagibacter sp.]
MFINNFNPVAMEFFSIEIRWYSLAYITGILMGWYFAKKKFIPNDYLKEKFDDYITYIIIGIIVGGRLGYVIFYNPGYYLNNIFDILKIWQGGMSFHGGLIGIIISSIIFAKKNNNDVFEYLDIIALVAPIGIFFGRIANFVNSELYGHETSVPWAVQFVQIDSLYRHPSQLYEALLEGFVLFLILLFYWNRNYLKKTGKLSALFLIIYSFFRFFTEYYRVPDDQLGYLILDLTMGQIISIIFFIIGLSLFFLKNDTKKKS